MTDQFKELQEWIKAALAARETCQNLEAFDALIEAQRARLAALRMGRTS